MSINDKVAEELKKLQEAYKNNPENIEKEIERVIHT